jgi:hypothetical protein
MISLSDFAEVEQTEVHADMSFGALIVIADFGADFFAVAFVILGFSILFG